MSDEELLIKYRKYKKKRMIIVFGTVLFLILVNASYLYLHFNNTSPSDDEKKKVKIIINDEIAPVIKLKTNRIEILRGDNIEYLDYIESVTDNFDGNLLNRIEYKKIDTSIVGEQSIIYSVSDSSGNFSQKTLFVLIKDKVQEDNKSDFSKTDNEHSTSETKAPLPKQETNSQNNQKQEEISKSPIQEESSKDKEKPSNKIVKYFLFKDGYTMSNVAEICANELRKTNRTGMCSPIQDESGIYLGMKLETN